VVTGPLRKKEQQMRQFVVTPWRLPDEDPVPHALDSLDEAERWMREDMPPNNGAVIHEIEVTVRHADDGPYEIEEDVSTRWYAKDGAGGWFLDGIAPEAAR
jgi:hypothetical protein